MTVSKNTPVNNHTGNGSNTTFDFDFLINSASELVVEKTKSDGEQVTLTNNVDYTIHEIGDEDGSYITFPITGSAHSVLGSDEKITLSLLLDIEQDKEYKNSSKLNLEVLEGSLDYLTRIAQIQDRKIERSVKIAEGAAVTTRELGQNVNVIADNIEAIEAVNANKGNVTTVAGIASDVSTVAGIASNVSAVGNSISDVNTCATNISDIQTACGSLVYYGEEEPSDSYKLWIDPNGDSDPHFTSTLKTKLNGIEAGAEVNIIEDVKVNGTSLTVTSKAVDITVPTDTDDLTNGAGFLVASDITGKQDTIDSSHKLSADLIDDASTTNKFVTASDKTTWSGKQDALVSGTNIKTINGSSVLGSGDLTISASAQSVTVLSGTSITLTDNSINTLTPTGNTTFNLPVVSDTTVFHQILVQLDLSTVYTIDLGATTYFGGSAPDLSSTGNYNIIYEYDNALSSWVVGVIDKGA